MRKIISRRKRYLVTVCGHFANEQIAADGQTIKIRAIHAALVERYGPENVKLCDSYNWKLNRVKYLLNVMSALTTSTNIVLVPAQNGLKIFVPLVGLLSYITEFKFHYLVIGGWLEKSLINNRALVHFLKRCAGIYVETNTMYDRLIKAYSFSNIFIIPNFKPLKILAPGSLKNTTKFPLKLLTLSRVMEEKGICDAISAVQEVNEKNGKTLYELDIYGNIESKFEEKFKAVMSGAPSYIKYKGIIDSQNTVHNIKDYYALLFPTRYMTEGLPGAIIDAYSAGLPIISSRWDSYSEIINEGVTGYGFEMGDIQGLKSVLEKCIDVNIINNMRKACLYESRKYTSARALNPLFKSIEVKI